MKKLALLVILFCSVLNAQKKYQGLLWEISGNGLAKKSYLYGSMHVSEKVSYHLSDSFFTHLLAADFVANESDPATWIPLYDFINGAYGNENNNDDGFYSQFCLQPLKETELSPLFVSNTASMNGLLFRTTEVQADFQEDTYLDMFVHQTGKKYKKKTIGLEDAKGSLIPLLNFDQTEARPNEDNLPAIMKLLKGRSFEQALMDYYRDKDLDMLDSLYSLILPQKYLKVLLYDRNIHMTESMIATAKTGSLFAVIGAAHLPGKDGVIELLRKKGYTVTPIIDGYTEKGKSLKKQIDDFLVRPDFQPQTTADGMVQLPLTSIVRKKQDIESPDLINGGVINLKRMLLKDFLQKPGEEFDPKTLEKLFFENIPGDILDKKSFKEDNYTGFDIINKTKTGNAQHYKYYITPLEIIAVNMSGKGNYTRQFENEVFDKIKIKKSAASWETVTPAKGGFSVETPGYYAMYGNDESYLPENIEMNAYDEKEKAYYFLLEHTLTSTDEIEDTAFELKRIQDEFYMQHDADSVATEISRTPDSYESQSKIGNRTISLKTIVNGPKYYLLGAVKASPENTRRFFGSFAVKPFVYKENMKVYNDSTGGFSVSVPEKQNEKLFWNSKKAEKSYDDKKNRFTGKSDYYTLRSESGKIINVRYQKFHRYLSEKNVDSVWVDYRKYIADDYVNNSEDYDSTAVDDYDNGMSEYASIESPALYNKKGFAKSGWDKALGFDTEQKKADAKILLSGEKITYNKEKNYWQMEVMATKAKSEQAVKYKAIFKDGYKYEFKTIVDRNYKNDDAFIEKVFGSFDTPAEKPEHSVFEDKVKLFINDAKSDNDSIRYSAMKSIYMVDIRKENVNEVKDFLSSFKFRPDEIDAMTQIFLKLGDIDDPQVIPFLESQYKKENANAIIQFAVLNALSRQSSKAGYRKLMELLEYDLPISDDQYDVSDLFNSFKVDPEVSQVLYPDIFQFYSIREYQQPIVDFATMLTEKGYINPKKLSGYKKMLLTNARLEYKRLAGWKAKQDSKEEDEAEPIDSPISAMSDYLNLLYPYKKDKTVAALFDKLNQLDIDLLELEMIRLETVNGKPDGEIIKKLLDNPKTRFITYQLLYNNKMTKPLENLSDDDIARAGIVHAQRIDTSKSKLEPAGKKTIPYNDKNITYFFYKVITEEDKNSDSYHSNSDNNSLVSIAFVSKNDKIIADDYKFLGQKKITDQSNETLFKTIIDQSLYGDMPRATSGKMNDRFSPGIDDY